MHTLLSLDYAIESNEVDAKCDSNQNGMDVKDDMKVLTGDSSLTPGQHYLIVSRDTASMYTFFFFLFYCLYGYSG